ncbi:DUF4956 domain-containing protein [Lachnospira sp.]|jgi:uncharacterized membrane protein YhiD involved in acid resistance|uniref:DUF4956 domain-containing protein n=1 Tax=Lachnospira sp. TaxID=2049031 RepID=UPI0025806124|nr:DUF4956 domain-containing protein [Lachnospira sp.]
MFESILSSATSSSFTVNEFLIAEVVAIVLGLIIGVAYMVACKNDGYSKNFIVGLSILPTVVAAVILFIGSDVARAFSMAGALTLVRFRSAPGNAKDISVVFLSMATGLGCGLGYIGYAAIFAVIAVILLIILSLSTFAKKPSNKKQLRVTIPENLNYTNAFNDVFEKFVNECRLTRVKTTNMGTMFELTYEVSLKDESKEKKFIDELRTRNGNLNIILGMMPAGNEGSLNG